MMSVGWEMTKLKYVADCNRRVLSETTSGDRSFKYVDIGAVGQGSITMPNELTVFADAPSRARRLAESGDTIISTVRTYLRAVATVPETNEDLVFSTGFAVLHPRPEVSRRFLAYVLQGDVFVDKVVANSVGVSYPAITASDLMALDLSLPPFDEQRAIADYLDQETAQIDALVAKQEEFIGLLQERRRAATETAVAVVEPFGTRLKHVVRSVRQGWSPQCYAWSADGVNRWAVLKAGAVNGGVFRSRENKELPASETPRPRTVVRAGDLVVSRANTRDLVGSAAVVDRDYPRLMLSDKLYAFDLDRGKALPRFVAAVLGSQRWRDLIEIAATGTSSSMLNISQDDIVNLPMTLPTVGEQQAAMNALDEQTSRIDTLIAKAEEHIALAKERRSALITAAVTGQFDVRTARKAG